jgi:FkbH-like protein
MEGWGDALRRVAALPPAEQWDELQRLANSRIDFMETAKLDRAAQRIFSGRESPAAHGGPIRLALLGSSTLNHLAPAIRVGGMRRGLWVEVFEGEYGQYRHELTDGASALHAFRPDVVLLALDGYHLAEGGTAEAALATMRACWEMARAMGATVLQQTALPVFPRIMGNNEQRLGHSPAAAIERLNAELRQAADEAGVHLLAVDAYAAEDGTRAWHDPVLWHRAKQEIHPRVSHIYGDLVGRMLAALRGRSAKCLVLDLDNTLWGGVIGDDGLEGIHLGQGSALGEAYVAFQRYALRLSERGIILAVCSKNDEVNALAPFEQHPEMVLMRKGIACFMANWQDKATNLREIARSLNIGLDALVFADDNPFERNLIRQELPEVAVPEMPEDPSFYIQTLADAGYFESLSITEEDRERTGQYQANAARESLRESTTDLAGYLRGLEMELIVRPFDRIGLGRIVQLINKTNQFNLTTRRYTEAEVSRMMADPAVLTYQLRLLDRFGDNGVIALLIGRLQGPTLEQGATLKMDTWLMSCRVLGRGVEEACLNLLAAGARAGGAQRIVGEYRPTAKNGMVRELYSRLGFTLVSNDADGSTRWSLDLGGWTPRPVIMRVRDETVLDKTVGTEAASGGGDIRERGTGEAPEAGAPESGAHQSGDGTDRDLQQTY